MQPQLPLPHLQPPLSLTLLSQNNRSLQTSQKLPKNKIILQCKPIATAVLSSMRNRICSYCLMEREVTRCSKCKLMYYCSLECQRGDWKVHKGECQIYERVWRKEVGLENIVAQFCMNVRVYVVRSTNPKINQQIQSMISLLQYQSPPNTQKHQQLTTILLQNLNLQKNQQNFTHLLKQVSLISLNSFTIQDYLCSYDSIGIGLYYPANFINHSCEPNCQQVFDGSRLKVVSLREISEGEEINISYVNRLMGYEERQRELREGYLFMCFCGRCQVQKMYDWNVFYLLCPECGKVGLIREGKGQISEEQLKQDGIIDKSDDQQQQIKQKQKQHKNKNIICTSCNKTLPIPQITSLLQAYQKHLQQFQKPQSTTSYKTLKKQFFALKKLVSYQNPIFQQLLNKVYLKCLAQAATQGSLYEEAYILLKDFLENLNIWYRVIPQQEQLPYFYAWKYAEMGKLAYYLSQHGKKGKLKKAAEYTEKAQEIIKKINFSNKFVEVQELNKRYQEMKISMSMKKSQVLR